MTALWNSIFLLFGILIGSFLNVCIYRIPKRESIAFPPSYCTNCETPLQSLDLVPVISYVFLKGRCRYCGVPISPQYPFIEILNALFYVLLFSKFGLSMLSIGHAVLISLLIVVTMIDLQYQIIPDEIIIFGFFFSLCFHLFYDYHFIFYNGILGFLIGGGFFLLIAVLTNGAMGGGDIKLMGLLGFWLGWKFILLIMLLSSIIGATISVFLIVTKKKKRKDYIPFGPFIAAATWVTIMYGQQIWEWYIVKVLGM